MLLSDGRHPVDLRTLPARALPLMLSVAFVFGQQSAADDLPPHPPGNVQATYDELTGTVDVVWDRSSGALRYEIGKGGTVVYSGGWDNGASLVAAEGVHAYSVRACNRQCGDWTDAVSVTVGAGARPSGIRYGGGFSDIVWTPNAYDEPRVPFAHGEIHVVRGAYRASDTDVRTLGGDALTALLTAYESGAATDETALSGRFFVVSGVASAVSRFSLSFRTNAPNRAVLGAGFFVATWDSVARWQARNDAGAAESFTPLTSDVVIAVGYRAPSSSGIDTLKSLVPDRPVPAGIRYGEGVTDIVFQPNIAWRTNQHPVGEMRLSEGVYRLPDGTERRVRGDLETSLLTPFEPLAPSRGDDSVGRFYVVSGKESAIDRFSLTYRDEREQRVVLEAGFFLADWAESTGWRARNNEGDAEAFVPLATDVVVAIGHRATTSSPGYDLLTPLVPKSVLSPRGQALTVDLRVDRLYRVEFARNLVTKAVDLGSIAPVKAASGIARVSDGVALTVDWQDDRLYRLEHTDDAVTSVTDLGSVSTVAGRDIAPEAIAHLSAGVALIADNSSNRLYRVEYNDTSVTATTRMGRVSSQPFGMAAIGPNAVLVADASYDGLYRLDFNQSGFSSTRLGKVPGLTLPLGLAHVSEGVALLVQDKNPDVLFRVEYGSTGVNRVYS
ncbi:MAG: hypothetical protein F4X36_08495, partial [Gammaproteobacteria bacterium]|nr:hypothetical protein [Gammaproteobacteria bacterium]